MPAEPALTREPARITVRCRFFGRYAELLETSEIPLDLPDGASVGDAVAAVRAHLPHGALLPDRPLAAVNYTQAASDYRLRQGDEVAFLPPLAGG